MSNSVETQVMTKLASVVDFIKSKSVDDLIEANNKGLVSLEKEQLRVLSEVIKQSIQSSFLRSSDELINYTRSLVEK